MSMIENFAMLFFALCVLVLCVFGFVSELDDILRATCSKCGKRSSKKKMASYDIVGGAYDYTFYKAVCKSCALEEYDETNEFIKKHGGS